MKKGFLIIAFFSLWSLAGCSAVMPNVVKYCENNTCDTIKEESPKQEILVKMYNLIKRNLGKSFPIYETPQGKVLDITGKDSSDQGFSFYTQGGPMPGVSTIKSIKFNDIVYIDRENMEIKFNVSMRFTWNLTPVLVVPAEGILAIKSAREIRFESTHLASWMVVGTGIWQSEWLIDYIDFDRMIVAGSFAMRGAGPLSIGGGSGYIQVTMGRPVIDDIETTAVAAAPVPEKKEEKAIAALPPSLAFNAVFHDSSGGGVLEGGKEISLRVEVENRGEGPAKDVQVLLSGHDDIISHLGERRTLGDIKAGEKKTAEFKATLPLLIAADAGNLRINVQEKRGFSPAEAKVLKIAVKPGIVREKVEVVSAVPKLTFSTSLKDQNNNRVLDGGEEISLQTEIENKGEGLAQNVQVVLSGHPTLIHALGASKSIGDLQPGEKKVAVFKGILPERIASESATLRIEIKEGKGFSPPERRVFQVAMRSVEVKEVIEVVSEVDVDDIPARIKGFEKKEDFALLFGISTYREKIIPEVKYASRDAEVMAKYLEHLSGIPRSNIMVLTNDKVTKSDLEAYLEDWLPRRVTKNSQVFVYYAGHGAPDPQGKDAYIVPFDGNPDFPTKLYPLSRMYAALNKLPNRDTVVMLDSCFSGAKGRSVTSEGARPLVMSLESQSLAVGKVTVVAASTGSQISSDYDKVHHGLFTYYLLRGIRGDADIEKQGVVNLGSLYQYVSARVSEKASLEFNRDQTPVLLQSAALAEERTKMPVARTR
ncbi:MAG: caspase family protein [Deltaproteobacteria bacterium]|nr:caspase family protein [Deltaproteobacteria bacterium]